MRSERTPMGGAERGGLWINVLSGPYGRGFEALCDEPAHWLADFRSVGVPFF